VQNSYLSAYRTLWLWTCSFKALESHHGCSWASTWFAEEVATTQCIWIENKFLSYHRPSIYQRYEYIHI